MQTRPARRTSETDDALGPKARAGLFAGDRELWSLLQRDRRRHNQTLNFIASENYASPAVLEALASHLNVKYAEGYPRARYYQGVEVVDDIETLAIERAKQLFGAEHANVQPHSGSTANMAAYYALLSLGDTILGMDLSHGGHLTHGSSASFSGQQFQFVSYHVTPGDETIDYDEVAQMAKEHRPKMIVAGASAYPRTIDFARFREIADSVGALFMADIAHIAGLVAAGVHPSPLPHADVVTTTTHKSLRGPRGGLILCRAAHARAIDRAVFPMLQGGPILGAVAARAVCFREAMQPDFKAYSEQVVKNARALAEGLVRGGLPLLSGGTDNHLLVVKLLDREYTGAQLATALERAGIITSKSTVPGETRSPRQTSGVRFGTPAMTTRGATVEQMRRVAELIVAVAEAPDNDAHLEEVRAEVRGIAESLEQI
ncbi:MAG: serine hydroxymethyltransferase [Chloroflexi bacterium]|nr:serine hydroxymethyltransferase [Chloroflexota bacterium]